MIYIFQGRSYGLGAGAQPELFFKVENQFCNHLHEFSGSALKVLFALASHIDAEGYCYPSLDTIAAKTGLGRQCVSDSITELCKLVVDGRRVMLAIQETQTDGTFKNNRYILFPSPDDLVKFAAVERKPRRSHHKPVFFPAADPQVPQVDGEPQPVPQADPLAVIPDEIPDWLRDAGGFEGLEKGFPQAEKPEPPYMGGNDENGGNRPDVPNTGLPSTVEPSTVNESLTRISLNNTKDDKSSFEAVPAPAAAAKKPRVYKEPTPELLPDSEGGYYLFNRLGEEYSAAHRRAPAAFGSVEQKKRFALLETKMSYPDLIKSVDTALLKPILGISRIIQFIESIQKSGGVYVRPVASGGGAVAARPGTEDFRNKAETFDANYQAEKERKQAIYRAKLEAAKSAPQPVTEPRP